MLFAVLSLFVLGVSGQMDWGNSGDANFDTYMRRFRKNACGYDSYSQQQRSDGDRWEVGIVKYECINGERTPIECQESDTQRWLRPGEIAEVLPTENADAGYYGRSCILDQDGYMRLATVVCVMNGRQYRAGEDFEDAKKKYWFRCVQDNELTVRIETAGCITDDGQRLDVGETIDIQRLSTWYKCDKKPSDAVAFCTQGCLQNGVRKTIGETWSNPWEPTKSYTCQRQNGQCSVVEVTNGKNLDARREETYAPDNTQPTNYWETAQPRNNYWETNTNTYNLGNGVRRAARSGYCTVSERGQFRFYLRHNSYTYAESQEWMRPAYFLCQWGYNSSYEVEKKDPQDFDPTRETQLTQSSPIYD